METITRKPTIKSLTDICLEVFKEQGIKGFINEIHDQILTQKVKFPILEYCASILYDRIPQDLHVEVCDRIERLKTEGGNVIIGYLLQLRLEDQLEESLSQAAQFISKADIWYVCDIIGERVFGHSILTYPEATLPYIKMYATHESQWVVRSVGAGCHYAVKKGLKENHAIEVFQVLLGHANAKNKEIRQGIGWAAKTTARYHPKIIQLFQSTIEDQMKVSNWFRKKVTIGLERNQYAQGN